MSKDHRDAIYSDLHHVQMTKEEEKNRNSALAIFNILSNYVRPKSVLDVGCGLGTWLAVAKSLGITELQGLEGSWLDRSKLAIDQSLVAQIDLENGFKLNRRFDLTICLEVAEHLSPSASDLLVTSLTQHSDIILFSAAIPYQGGHHHVNEQFPEYWSLLFRKHGFHPIDALRPRIWDNKEVLWWLRQNILLFANDSAFHSYENLVAERLVPRPLSVVHPDVYLSRLNAAQASINEYNKLIKLLSQEGSFTVTKLPNGQLNVQKVQ